MSGAPLSSEAVGRKGAPHVVGKLGSDGQWHVLMMVPLQPPVWDAHHELLLDADQAERLALQLTEYAALVRDKTGLVR